jgi:hypothetical protein
VRRTLIAAVAGTVIAGIAAAHDGGRHDEEGRVPDVRTPRNPTYHRHVAKILSDNCTTCHHDGDIAPMSLDTYEGASLWMARCLEEIAAGRMPPWQPTRGVGHFEGERGLTDREWATLAAWHESGMPEGKPRRRAKQPAYVDGWVLGTPDAVLAYDESFTVPGSGDDVYRCFPIRTDFGHDVFVQAFDIRPGDRRVVHHVVLYLDTTGESHQLDAAEEGPGYTCFGGPGLTGFGDIDAGDIDIEAGQASLVLGGWAPGNRPHRLPKGKGVRIPAGATVVMQVHYHPFPGESVDDRTEFGLYVTDDPSTEDVYLLPVVNMEFTIPPGAPAHEVTAVLDPEQLIAELTGFPIDVSAEIHSVLPHMHLLGKSIEVDLDLPDGTSQRLVEIERWDFDWQDSYHFRKPVQAPVGSRLRLRCVFDNSSSNPNNPNSPPQPVSWGERTVDEMALAFVAVTLRFPDEVLDLFELFGRDLPHPRGLRPIRTGSPPQIRSATIDARGRLVLRVKGLKGGGRLELDGRPVDDAAVWKRKPRRLRFDADSVLDGAESGELRIRRADGRLSPAFPFVR